MGAPGIGHGLLENATHTDWAEAREATIPCYAGRAHITKGPSLSASAPPWQLSIAPTCKTLVVYGRCLLRQLC